MKKIQVTLPDGSVREYDAGTTVLEVAKNIGKKLAKDAVAGKVDGALVDLQEPIQNDVSLEIVTFGDPEGTEVFRHTTAHILAQAVKRLFPQTKLAIGPAIEDGFYYDFSTDRPFTPEELERIEEEMNNIIEQDLPIKRHEICREDALEMFEEIGEDLKLEMIDELSDESNITYYTQGEFADLCSGPHLPSTGKVGAVKLLNVAGAYWRGDEKNEMLQRIYGTSFADKKELDKHLAMIEEAKKRDHRKIGKQLDLFSLHDEGPGFPFFHPKGMVIRNTLEDFWREEHAKRNYKEIKTPIALHEDLWKKSGHWDNYRENMYFTKIDDGSFAIKPMNCPGGMLFYMRKVHSYRDFPLRVGELGLVHRHELSGTLHGLMRVRCFTQDDAHIFMLPSQIVSEVQDVIQLADELYSVFGFEYMVELSTKPEKAMGTDEEWDAAIGKLKEALDGMGLPYKINEGDGAFYGPKIDFHLKDCIGRTWQCGTIQLDFQMPERFDLTYIGEDGERHRPVTVHRTIFGSMERFMGILIEHYAGAFPAWLAPVQVKIMAIADRHADYAHDIEKKLRAEGIRVESDVRNEKVGYKIREAQTEKVPYMLIVGDKEVEENTVSLRSREEGDKGTVSLSEFLSSLREEIDARRNTLTCM